MQPKRVTIVIPQAIRQALIDHVLASARSDGREGHAFLFGARHRSQMLMGRLWRTPSAMYTRRSQCDLELGQNYVVSALEYARSNGFSLIDVHSHPFTKNPQFSDIDNEYGVQNAQWVAQKMREGAFPDITWGMIVVGRSGQALARTFDYRSNNFVAAHLASPGNYAREENDGRADPENSARTFDRQIRLWGLSGQRRLAQARVAIVGLGGLGSVMSEQLVRIGVRNLTLIDGDLIESSNVARLSGASLRDVGLPKVAVIGRYLRRIAGKALRLNIRQEYLTREGSAALEDCDLLVGTVDREGARLLLNENAIRYLIPYVDVASGIKTNRAQVVRMGGHVRIVEPGSSPCLQCYQDGIDPLEAALDLMEEADLRVRRELGYVDGTKLSPEPSVIPLNGILASLASQEVSKLVTGFHAPHGFLGYDALANSLTIPDKIHGAPLRSCPCCGIGGLLGLATISSQTSTTAEEQAELLALFRNAQKDY